jgi:hypothetical protein
VQEIDTDTVHVDVGAIGNPTVLTTPRRCPRSDSLENPFLVPFTPSKRIRILRNNLASSSATSYLIPTSSIPTNIRIITPQREQPEPFSEPDWDTLLTSNITHLEVDDLVLKVEELRRGLRMARDCIRAREAVIESAHATNVILELTCQRLRNTLNRRAEEKAQKKDKRSLFSDGKARVVTDDDFIQALEEIEERGKEEEEKKERRKVARARAKESKEFGRKAWEQALEEWKAGKAAWKIECERLREGGCRRKDLPRAPKMPRKVDVLLAAASREGANGSDDEGGHEEEGEDERTHSEGNDGDGSNHVGDGAGGRDRMDDDSGDDDSGDDNSGDDDSDSSDDDDDGDNGNNGYDETNDSCDAIDEDE